MGGRVIDTDVCVVGAGIIGLAHALEARARGLRVVMLERSQRAVGASVRNFGHGCLGAMGEGLALQCALESRARWIELAPQAGLDLWLDGTLVLAREDDELAALEEISRDQRRGAVIIDAHAVGALVPLPTDGLEGGLHARLDFRVNPRQAVAALAGLLEGDPHAQVLWEAPVHAVASGTVHGAGVTVNAPLVLLCPGPAWETLAPDVHPQRAGLTTCKLQMLRVRAPGGERYGPALMTGLSLLRYPGFAAAEASAAVGSRIRAQRPELLDAGIHLIVTQLPGGDLIIGDSHDYGRTVSPFAEERVFDLILEEARRLLGAQELEVRERWQGVYPTAPGEPFLVQERQTGVWITEVVSGVGMTTGLGLARRVLSAVIDGDDGALAGADFSRLHAGRPAAQPGAQPRSEAAGAGCGS